MEAVTHRFSVKKVVLEISINSQENTCARVSFLIKLQTSGLLKKRLWHKCFPVNFAKFLKTHFLTEHLVVAASEQWNYSTGKSIFFFGGKIYFIYLMASINFARYQNTRSGFIWGYIYTLNTKTPIKGNTWNVIIFTIKCKIFLQNLVGTGLHLSRKECIDW